MISRADEAGANLCEHQAVWAPPRYPRYFTHIRDHLVELFAVVHSFAHRDIDAPVFLLTQTNISGSSLSSPLQAYERRFPTCHLIPMFVASDVVDEDTSEDGSTHRVERRCALDVDAPRLLKRVCFRTLSVSASE